MTEASPHYPGVPTPHTAGSSVCVSAVGSRASALRGSTGQQDRGRSSAPARRTQLPLCPAPGCPPAGHNLPASAGTSLSFLTYYRPLPTTSPCFSVYGWYPDTRRGFLMWPSPVCTSAGPSLSRHVRRVPQRWGCDLQGSPALPFSSLRTAAPPGPGHCHCGFQGGSCSRRGRRRGPTDSGSQAIPSDSPTSEPCSPVLCRVSGGVLGRECSPWELRLPALLLWVAPSPCTCLSHGAATLWPQPVPCPLCLPLRPASRGPNATGRVG